MSAILERAEAFFWLNGRLLDRRLFAYHFKAGSREDVLMALAAYQNSDGGFGNALEADLRCPDSQPVAVQMAFEILDQIGPDQAMLQRACDYLSTITSSEGGVPFVLPAVSDYPHAPWWQTDPNLRAAINPTAALVGLLWHFGFEHAWVEPAAAFCWNYFEQQMPESNHDMLVSLSFAQHVPDRARGEQLMKRLGEHLMSSGLVLDLEAQEYGMRPLDWAATPDHPLRRFFDPRAVEANLDYLVATQHEDGSWKQSWPALSSANSNAWSSVITLNNLLILQANGRL